MAPKQEWHYAKNGQQFGPVSSAELKQLGASGSLSPVDLIWKDGWSDWKAAGTVNGLFSSTRPASASTPLTQKSIPQKSFAKNLLKMGSILIVAFFGAVIVSAVRNPPNSTPMRIANTSKPPPVNPPIQEQKKPDASMSSSETVTAVTTNRSDILTEDFYPFILGSKRRTIRKIRYDNGSSMETRFEFAHEQGGVVRTRMLHASGTGRSGERALDLPTVASPEERYRKQNGFIEIGSEEPTKASFFYEPALKIGAKVGDKWKIEPSHIYTVLPFENRMIDGKSILCAVVERTSMDHEGQVFLNLKTTYGQGIGPVAVVSSIRMDGTMHVAWTEELISMLKQ